MTLYDDRPVRITNAQKDAVRRTEAVQVRTAKARADYEADSAKEFSQSSTTFVKYVMGTAERVPRFHPTNMDTNARLLLGLVCAGLCYEYAGYPHLTLHEHIFPFMQAVRLLNSQQLYSIFEAPGKVRFVAFPGTHDSRTALTDVKFARTDIAIMRKLNYDNSLHGGIVQTGFFRAHTGFLTEANKVILPEVLDWIHDGYEVVYCGHSLGGAIATLATVHMLTRPFTFYLLPFTFYLLHRHCSREASLCHGWSAHGGELRVA